MRGDGSQLIQDRKYHLKTYKECFVGKEFVDWLITKGEARSRADAVDLGRQLVDAGVISHGRNITGTTTVCISCQFILHLNFQCVIMVAVFLTVFFCLLLP